MRSTSFHWARIFILVGLFGLLTACVPESVNPLSDPETSPLDLALPGSWHGIVDDDEELYLHFLPDSGGVMQVVGVSVEPDSETRIDGSWTIFKIHTTQIGDTDYMNIQIIDDAEDSDDADMTTYLIARYAISDAGALTIWLLDFEAAKVAVRAGLPGVATDGKWGGEVRITANYEEWQSYLASVDPETLFFEPYGTFTRIE